MNIVLNFVAILAACGLLIRLQGKLDTIGTGLYLLTAVVTTLGICAAVSIFVFEPVIYALFAIHIIPLSMGCFLLYSIEKRGKKRQD